MDWLGWILSSCVVLSLYDLSKKASVRGNAVFPTLLGSTAAGWLAVTAFLVWRGAFAAALGTSPANVALLLLKSCIVGASWTATYMALRTLPITFAAPIRATGPLWTLLGAIVLFSEVPTAVQAAGMAMIVVGCVLFSRSAAKEGIDFWRSRAVLYAFLGTVLGSCSALYDKHLLKNLAIPTGTVPPDRRGQGRRRCGSSGAGRFPSWACFSRSPTRATSTPCPFRARAYPSSA